MYPGTRGGQSDRSRKYQGPERLRIGRDADSVHRQKERPQKQLHFTTWTGSVASKAFLL